MLYWLWQDTQQDYDDNQVVNKTHNIITPFYAILAITMYICTIICILHLQYTKYAKYQADDDDDDGGYDDTKVHM